jgi:hypothetical protein
MRRRWLIAFYLVLCTIFLVITPPALSQEVDVEIAPEFTGNDEQTISECFANVYQAKFPFDFFLEPISSSGDTTCPQLDIFGYVQDACFLYDIYLTIRPAILISLFISAIFAL